MLEKKILIAGLPDAGKSTYIAALNGVMSQEEIGRASCRERV